MRLHCPRIRTKGNKRARLEPGQPGPELCSEPQLIRVPEGTHICTGKRVWEGRLKGDVILTQRLSFPLENILMYYTCN